MNPTERKGRFKKAPGWVLCVLAWGGMTAVLFSAPKARDAITEEALREETAAVPPLKALLETSAKPVVEKPAMQSSLWSRSIILTDGEMFTLVPVGSILHLPPSLRKHVAVSPDGKPPEGRFTFWPNFLKRNEAWLSGLEVKLEMAQGDATAAKALLQSIATDTRVLVALYKGGPVTILEEVPGKTEPPSK